MFLEVLHLRVPSVTSKYAGEAAHAYPAVRAILLKHLIRLSACLRRVRPALLGIDTVEDIVPVKALEEGVSRLVTLLSRRLGRRYKGAIRRLLGSRIVGSR